MRQGHVPSRKGITTATAALAVLIAGPAEANVFSKTGADPRVEIARGAYPYSAIGFMETSAPVPVLSGARSQRALISGTAFMISPCYALTAYHVVFGNDPASGQTALKHPVWISLGGDNRKFALNRIPAMAVAWGDFAHDQTRDWALLEVVGCPGGRPDIRWLPFEPRGAKIENRRARVGGFDGQFSPFRLTGQKGCSLGKKIDAMTVQHFCASRPGMSGAPILVREADHILRATALISREQYQVKATMLGKPPALANLAVIVHAALRESAFYPKIATDRASGNVFPIPTSPPPQ